MKCRHCQAAVSLPFIDLGTAPPSNAYLSEAKLAAPETWFPLRVFVCTACWLVQTEDHAHHAALFSPDYAYFSSFSTEWLEHSERYVAQMVERFGLDTASQVVEVACNDGYLLQYVRGCGIPCLGIEPTASTAAAARAKGIDVVEAFFGMAQAKALADSGRRADLMVANNVLAHVPDINDFVAGFAHLLQPRGVATFEFPHLMRLVAEAQFDTIYHEHFSYLSLTSLVRVFAHNGLSVFDVEELPTHGGSLRVFAQRTDVRAHVQTSAVTALMAREAACGMAGEAYYGDLQSRAERIKDDLVIFLVEAQRAGKKVGAYGAAAKGNTLLNFAGIRRDLLPWVADRNPSKQGRFMPGSRIPIVTESVLRQARPDYVLVLPWNLGGEIRDQLRYARDWGAKFVVAVPGLQVS